VGCLLSELQCLRRCVLTTDGTKCLWSQVRSNGRNAIFLVRVVIGMVIVVVAYLLTNLSYFFALPYGEIANGNSTAYRQALPVATKAARTFAGPLGMPFVSVLFVISTLGTLNACVLTFARVPYATASDGLFFGCFRHVNASTRVPVVAITLQTLWSRLLAVSGTYDQLTDYAIFAMWILYAFTTSSVFILRTQMADHPRPYSTPAYPFLPAAFFIMAVWLVWNTVHTRPLESTCGLVVITFGIPFYTYFRRKGSGEGRSNSQQHDVTEASTDTLSMLLAED